MYYIIYFIVNFALVIRGDSDSAPAFRIFNGNNANILNRPYMVSIEFQGKHHCGGSLIKPNLVLSAAHCFVLDGLEVPEGVLLARAGTAIKGKGGQTAAIIKYCIHPNYIGESILVKNDEAVVKLNRSLTLDLRTQLIELQPRGIDVPDNSIGIVTGWGYTQGKYNSSRESPLILQEIKVFKINQEVCNTTSMAPIQDGNTCYGVGLGLKSTCHGDSGGPLVVDGKQVGIVAFGVLGCGLPLFFPNVYTRVEHEEVRHHIDLCIAAFEQET